MALQSQDGNAVSVTYAAPTVANGSVPLVTTCTPPNGSSFAVGQQTTVTCTTTDALQRTDSCTFTVTIQPPPRLSATSFLAFGDSITWGEDGRAPTVVATSADRNYPRVQLPANEIYPNVLQSLLAQRYRLQTPTVFNAGCPGETITGSSSPCSGGNAFSRFVRLTSTRRYQAVLIMEGSNDLYNGDAAVYPYAMAGLRQMILDARSRNIQPFLATIPPMDPSGFRGIRADMVPTFNAQVVQPLAAQENVPLVDVYSAFDNINTEIGFDGLHPTAAGYQKIAEAFLLKIEATLQTRSPASSIAVQQRRPK